MTMIVARILRVLQGHAGEVFSASFSPDGLRIVSASGDKTVRVWDTNSGENLRVLRGHTDFVIDARFSPDGHRIVSADGDGTLLIWNVTPALHTPLMSVTNAISGIILIGGMLLGRGKEVSASTILGAVAVLLSTINVAGGFLVTQRMLRMFRK